MRLRSISAILAVAIVGVQIAPTQTTSRERPVESKHVAGPDGLEGWTLDSPIPYDSSHGNYPFTLVIGRSGKVLRKIDGHPFVWAWIFWDEGRQIAYEAGPLHFGLLCELYDLKTGRVLKSIDCFHGIPDDAPAWLVALETPH
jgi:hypothetical protein